MAAQVGRERPPLLGRLDEGAPTRRQCVLLVGVAAVLAWYWLPAVVLTFVQTVVEGRHTMPPPHPGLGILLRSCLANGIIAFAVGALAGSSARRFRWAVGPALLVLMAAYNALAVMSIGHLAVTIPGQEAPVYVRAQWHAPPVTVVWFLGILVCAAVGGHVAARVFRHVPLSVAVSGALGWVCVSLVAALIDQVWSSRYNNLSYSQWSMADLALKAPHILPYVIGGVWMRWATRDARPWTGAAIVGAAAAMQVFRGYVGMLTSGFLSALLLYGSWSLQPVVWASVGAWVGGLVLGLGSRGQQVKQAVAVLAIGVIAIAIGLLASGAQHGIPAP